MVTYDYYRIFYYAALFKSFSKAAEVPTSNQPNIARTITRLESELSAANSSSAPIAGSHTPEGEALFKHVAIACEQLDLGREVISEMRGLKTGIVSIGASETALRLFSWTASYHSTGPIPVSISRSATAKLRIPLKPLSADKWKCRSFPPLSRLGRNTTMRPSISLRIS